MSRRVATVFPNFLWNHVSYTEATDGRAWKVDGKGTGPSRPGSGYAPGNHTKLATPCE